MVGGLIVLLEVPGFDFFGSIVFDKNEDGNDFFFLIATVFGGSNIVLVIIPSLRHTFDGTHPFAAYVAPNEDDHILRSVEFILPIVLILLLLLILSFE